MRYRYARYTDQFVITRESDGKQVFIPRGDPQGGRPAEYDLLWAQIERAESSAGRDLQAVLANWFEDKETA